MLLNVPIIIIIRVTVGENNVLGQINIYRHMSILGVGQRGVHGLPYIFRLLFIKMEILKEHHLSYNQILHNFHLILVFLL